MGLDRCNWVQHSNNIVYRLRSVYGVTLLVSLRPKAYFTSYLSTGLLFFLIEHECHVQQQFRDILTCMYVYAIQGIVQLNMVPVRDDVHLSGYAPVCRRNAIQPLFKSIKADFRLNRTRNWNALYRIRLWFIILFYWILGKHDMYPIIWPGIWNLNCLGKAWINTNTGRMDIIFTASSFSACLQLSIQYRLAWTWFHSDFDKRSQVVKVDS